MASWPGQPGDDPDTLWAVETTMMSNSSFEDALDYATFTEMQGTIDALIYIDEAREDGITQLPF